MIHNDRFMSFDGTAVQHKFRRTLLVPSREENMSSQGAAVQHNFRRTLLLPSREENINPCGRGTHGWKFLGKVGGAKMHWLMSFT